MSNQQDFENTKSALSDFLASVSDVEAADQGVATAQAGVVNAASTADQATRQAAATLTDAQSTAAQKRAAAQSSLDVLVADALADGFAINLPKPPDATPPQTTTQETHAWPPENGSDGNVKVSP
jgi:hypothetical protein